jgi:hypothetical protein
MQHFLITPLHLHRNPTYRLDHMYVTDRGKTISSCHRSPCPDAAPFRCARHLLSPPCCSARRRRLSAFLVSRRLSTTNDFRGCTKPHRRGFRRRGFSRVLATMMKFLKNYLSSGRCTATGEPLLRLLQVKNKDPSNNPTPWGLYAVM